MNWQHARSCALAARCQTIGDLLGLPRSVDADFVRNVLDRFLADGDGPEADQAWTSLAYVLTQAFHGRVPTTTFTAALRAAYAQGSASGLHRALVENPAFRTSPQAAAPLVTLDSPGLAIDVSETCAVGLTSGIQRVVRSIARCVPQSVPRSMLVRWCDGTHCFTPLTEPEVERLLSAAPMRVDDGPANGLAPASRILGAVRRAVLWSTRRIDRILHRRWLRAHRPQRAEPSVFLWRDSLLLPELAGDRQHVEALRLVTQATPVRSTLVFYDAIPIRHPEFFTPVTLSSYLRSLSLARDVDAISCISHTVRDDLMNLLAVLPRQRPPLLAVHALGADLPDEASLQPVTFDRPVVLCVGTVEPRKNQLRILQAMMSAQRSGSRFVGVFAGNAGWLNGDFRTALAAATAAGHDIVLRENVSNAELRGLYAAAAFTIYGSLDEGFGLPIIESLRHGCPCITSDRGSMREIAEQTGGCLLVDPENPADIAAAIVGLADDPDALARLAREAEEADWPTWQQYTAQLVRFATRPAPGLEIPQRRTA